MKLTITNPKAVEPVIAPGRHFLVAGYSDEAISPGSTLTVELSKDGEGTVRKITTSLFKNQQYILPKDGLTLYPLEADPELVKFKASGFLPLLVQEGKDVHDYTQKAWYDEHTFKALVPSASLVANGACFDDGFGFVDAEGRSLEALAPGKYQLRVALIKGELLAETIKELTIGANDDLLICRFNPEEQKKRIVQWALTKQLHYIQDDLPGYLNPYLGVWYYHMGLLTMYRACDLAEYAQATNIHLFLYNLTFDSTSYASELALLQHKGVVDQLHVYHYANGENGTIVEFKSEEYLKVVRMEYADVNTRENHYDLTAAHQFIAEGPLEARTIGLHVIVKPLQLPQTAFILQNDNTYRIEEELAYLRYCFDDGQDICYFQKKTGLIRYQDSAIGESLFEAFHLFELEAAKTYHITIEAFSNRGRRWPETYSLTIITKPTQSDGYIEV